MGLRKEADDPRGVIEAAMDALFSLSGPRDSLSS